MNREKNMKISWLSDSLIMAKRNLLKTKHNPEKLFDVTLQPAIMMIIFSLLMGGAIAGSVDAYLPLIVPGIIVQTLIQASATAGTQLREDINTGVFDRFNSLPMSRIAPLSGLLLADILRYVIAATIAIITGYAIGWDPAGGLLYVIIATIFVIITCWSISWIFACLGLLFKHTSTITGVSMLVIMVLSFVSSAYIPIETLPTPLYYLASVNPVTHLIEAFKAISYEQTFNKDVVMAMVSSAVILIIFIPLTLRLYNKNVK